MGANQSHTITYNTYEFVFPAFSYHARTEWDPTHKIMQGVTFTFRGTFHIIGADETAFNLARRSMEALITVPMKRFKWMVGTRVFFDIGGELNEYIGTNNDVYPQPDQGTLDPLATWAEFQDCRWGPKPRIVSIQQMPGGLSAKVTWELECFVKECTDQSAFTDFEEFWWTFAYSFDRNWIARIHANGVYRYASPYNVAYAILPDQRYFPPLWKGFHRQSINHSLSPDGSTLTWSIEDVQQWRTLPSPLTDGQATFTMNQYGAQLRKTLSGSFSAPPNVDKRTIFQFIHRLIEVRFPNLFGNSNQGGTNTATLPAEMVHQYSVTNHEFDNRMDFTVTTSCSADVLLSKVPTGTSTANAAQMMHPARFGDITDVTPGTYDAWTASNGIANCLSVLGTTNFIPQQSPMFFSCTNMADFIIGGTNKTAINSTGTYTGTLSMGGFTEPNTSTSTDRPLYSDYVQQTSADPFRFSGQRQNPYFAYAEQYQFILDRNIAVIPVASSNRSDITMQTANPTFRVLQVGSARRLNKVVDRPSPIYLDSAFTGTNGGRIVREEVTTSAPVISGDGRSVEYSTRWVYEIVYSKIINTLNASESVPAGSNKAHVRIPHNRVFDENYFKDNLEGKVSKMDSGGSEFTINDDGTFAPDGAAYNG